MLLDYFGFRVQPFGATPDPQFLYYSRSHREALASLKHGTKSERGILGLIAEPGMGKTTLLFRMLELFQRSARTTFLLRTQSNSHEFLSHMLADVVVDDCGDNIVGIDDGLREQLLREARAGCGCVIVIDEAHNLESSVLKTLRLLSSFAIGKAKLLQIVIAGHTSLADKLAGSGLERSSQGISCFSRLTPLEPREVPHYISHRLRAAGYRGKSLFSPEAESALAESSAGIPRRINNLCFNALLLCYASRQRRVERQMVEDVIPDLDLQASFDAFSPTGKAGMA